MDATNPVGALGVMLRQREQARLIEAPQDDFALGHLGLVSVMTIHHGRREDARLPQRSYEFVLGHRRGSHWLTSPRAFRLHCLRLTPLEDLGKSSVNTLPKLILQF